MLALAWRLQARCRSTIQRGAALCPGPRKVRVGTGGKAIPKLSQVTRGPVWRLTRSRGTGFEPRRLRTRRNPNSVRSSPALRRRGPFRRFVCLGLWIGNRQLPELSSAGCGCTPRERSSKIASPKWVAPNLGSVGSLRSSLDRYVPHKRFTVRDVSPRRRRWKSWRISATSRRARYLLSLYPGSNVRGALLRSSRKRGPPAGISNLTL